LPFCAAKATRRPINKEGGKRKEKKKEKKGRPCCLCNPVFHRCNAELRAHNQGGERGKERRGANAGFESSFGPAFQVNPRPGDREKGEGRKKKKGQFPNSKTACGCLLLRGREGGKEEEKKKKKRTFCLPPAPLLCAPKRLHPGGNRFGSELN